MQAMTQFVQGTGAYFTSIVPAVESGGMSKVAAITIYSAFARNFRLGKEVDDVLDRLAEEAEKQAEMEAQQPPPPNPEMEKLALERQRLEEIDKPKAQLETTKLQAQQADQQIAAQAAAQKAALEAQLLQEKLEFQRQEQAAILAQRAEDEQRAQEAHEAKGITETQ
jgi:hypothetical protein